MKSFLITFLLATTLGLLSTGAAIAVETADENKLAGIIENAKILGKGYKVRITFSGPEVAVSTFRAVESSNTDNDCKITAALIAKELLINHDFGFRKARIHFHEPTMLTMFREVTVSYAELQALESGAVKQSDFMESLSVTKLPENVGTTSGTTTVAGAAGSSNSGTIGGSPGSGTAGCTGTGIAGASGSTTSSSGTTDSAGATAGSSGSGATGATASGNVGSTGVGTAGSDGTSTTGATTAIASTSGTGSPIAGAVSATAPGSSASQAPKKPVETVKLYTSKKGSRFAIPEGWVVEDNFPHGQGLLFKLFSPANGERNIEFSFDGTSGKTPAQCALAQKQNFSYSGVKIERYEQVKFGAGKYPGALIVLTYPNWSDEGKRYYEMHLYFGQHGGIYDLWGWCAFSQFRNVDAAFQKIMTTMEFSPAKGPATTAKGAAAAKPSPAKKK